MQEPHSALAEALRIHDAAVQVKVTAILKGFFAHWGEDVFAAEPCLREDLRKPLILMVDWQEKLVRRTAGLLVLKGYRVTIASNARIMLAKVAKLRPSVIFTGLNALHFYQPAYEWMLANLAKPDGIPTLFCTAAAPGRMPREVPHSPLARVMPKFFDMSELYANVAALLKA